MATGPRRDADVPAIDLKARGLRGAQAACIAGLAFAAVSVYWGVGGTWLLDTLGGSLERQARTGSLGAVVVLLTTASLKVVAAVVPLLAVGGRLAPVWRRRARALAWVDASVLTLYGLVYTGVGLLLQAGVIGMPAAPNRRAFAWHAFLWDPWFLVWGLLVVLALLRSRHTWGATRRDRRSQPEGPREDPQ
jgi:hypothetical protein